MQSSSELDRWRDAVMKLQPMSALGQLAQMVAHDLNNHIQSIVLHLELLKQLGERDEKVGKNIDRIAEAIEKIQTFVAYLHDVRTKSEERSEADVKDVVEGIVMLLRGTLRRANLACEISCDNNLPPVGMSMLLVHEVLLNVVMNAVEASEHSGAVAIKVTHKDDSIVVEVRDPGRGMSEEGSAHAVEPFFTTKGDDHLGLGLTVSNAVLDECGGSLAYAPAESGGTIVKVALPRAPHP